MPNNKKGSKSKGKKDCW